MYAKKMIPTVATKNASKKSNVECLQKTAFKLMMLKTNNKAKNGCNVVILFIMQI